MKKTKTSPNSKLPNTPTHRSLNERFHLTLHRFHIHLNKLFINDFQ